MAASSVFLESTQNSCALVTEGKLADVQQELSDVESQIAEKNELLASMLI